MQDLHLKKELNIIQKKNCPKFDLNKIQTEFKTNFFIKGKNLLEISIKTIIKSIFMKL